MTENRSAGEHAPQFGASAVNPPNKQGRQDAHSKLDKPDMVVRVGSPTSLLALVPQLLSFQPRDSIVLLGARPPRGRVRLTLRFDLPKTSDLAVADELARHAMGVLVAQGFTTGVAVGYGPGRLVTPVADAIRRHAADLGFRLTEVLRAQDNRYWSYLCTEPSCCSPDGEPYDVSGHPVTAAFAEAGAPPVLASRQELAASVAPLGGAAGEFMVEATRRAEEHAARLVAHAARFGRRGAARRLIASVGVDAVREAIDLYRADGEFSSNYADLAWISVVLRDLRVRDDAWARMDPEFTGAHLRLWTDLTRRARPGFVAPAASLLAFVAWQSGNGALANVALDRAQADNAGYTMARLLREVVDSGAPPRRLPMTPEEVAASYDRADDDCEQGYGDDDCDPDDTDDDLDEGDQDPDQDDGPCVGSIPPGEGGPSAGGGLAEASEKAAGKAPGKERQGVGAASA
jgi:hypothetical protein